MTLAAGATPSHVSACVLSSPLNVAGFVVLRNVRITDGAGTVRQNLWQDGDSVLDVASSVLQYTSYQSGPANSCLVYIRDNTNALVANQFFGSVEGV
jgi:hypothetical protein